jgi:hypothetical protein
MSPFYLFLLSPSLLMSGFQVLTHEGITAKGGVAEWSTEFVKIPLKSNCCDVLTKFLESFRW